MADPGVAWRGWLASVCVCGIPSYPTHTLPILSLHTHWTPAGFSSLLVSCPSQGTQSLLLPSSSSGCQNICHAVSVVKIFSTGCTQWAEGRRGGNSIGIVWGLSADKWASDASLWMPSESATTRTRGPRRSPAEDVVLDRGNLASAYLS